MLFAELVVVGPGEAVGFIADALEEVEEGRIVALQRNSSSAFEVEDFFPFC